MWAMLSMPVAVIVFMVLLFTGNPQALGIPNAVHPPHPCPWCWS